MQIKYFKALFETQKALVSIAFIHVCMTSAFFPFNETTVPKVVVQKFLCNLLVVRYCDTYNRERMFNIHFSFMVGQKIIKIQLKN